MLSLRAAAWHDPRLPLFGQFLSFRFRQERNHQKAQKESGGQKAQRLAKSKAGDGLHHAGKDQHGSGDDAADVETKTGAGGTEVVGK